MAYQFFLDLFIMQHNNTIIYQIFIKDSVLYFYSFIYLFRFSIQSIFLYSSRPNYD